jgi:formate-dependent nitrite reductase membrane component NrfD
VLKGNYRAAKIWGLFGFPIAISVHGYTGFILALAKGRAFWNTPLNPILFLVSAMVSGLALIIIILNLRSRYLAQAAEQKAADSRITNQLVVIKRIRLNSLGQCTACAFILCGIMAMRIIIVLGGQSVRLH